MRGSFIAVLERIKEAGGDTLLLRNDIAPVSGQLTMELLNAYKAKNTFHHIPATETALLSALGRILAAQREGSYDQLATEPPATKDNVIAALRNHPLLRGIRLWEMIQKVHAPKQSAPVQASVLSSIVRPSTVPLAKPPAVPSAKPPPPPTMMAAAAVAKPVARPPSPPVAKPIARPPGAPVAKPPQGMLRPPMSKLPPPSQGNAA